jgi:hypothetical protein
MFYGYTLKTKFRNMMLMIIIFLTFGDWNPQKIWKWSDFGGFNHPEVNNDN